MARRSGCGCSRCTLLAGGEMAPREDARMGSLLIRSTCARWHGGPCRTTPLPHSASGDGTFMVLGGLRSRWPRTYSRLSSIGSRSSAGSRSALSSSSRRWPDAPKWRSSIRTIRLAARLSRIEPTHPGILCSARLPQHCLGPVVQPRTVQPVRVLPAFTGLCGVGKPVDLAPNAVRVERVAPGTACGDLG